MARESMDSALGSAEIIESAMGFYDFCVIFP